jgi:hypothetical protein
MLLFVVSYGSHDNILGSFVGKGSLGYIICLMDMDKFQATTCEESCHPMVLYIGDCFAQALSQHMIGKGSFVILPTWGKDIRRSVDSLLEKGTMKTSEAPSLESKLK